MSVVADKVDGEWVVDEGAKQAILDYFRVRDVEPEELGPFEYMDKIPLKHGHAERGVRVVPGAVVRYGSFLGEGVIVMPGFVNIAPGPERWSTPWATVARVRRSAPTSTSPAEPASACWSRSTPGR